MSTESCEPDCDSTRQIPFEEFVAARAGVLRRTAYLLTRDNHLAEDLVQTVLAKAWRKWKRIKGSPVPYVHKMLINEHLSWRRRRWNGERPTEFLPEGADRDPTDAVGPKFDLWEAVGRLPKRQRATLVLRYYEDLSEAQIAEVMGCSVGTVKSQTSKALTRLRRDPTLDGTYIVADTGDGGRSL
ncbi:SigE family RNA polymerase sigma factor [Solicola gregarius]|uniref:SigE family RNA polymerase sigma factor n=1 Tax=Solicola gregarius TaxID=2908642 RepID=A0AA46TK05_9ACTN|nr:SigE family RNA polymerase sigma factor [Solicola gregarius]UYM06696.1 SigE family RNA polymerase sigma factor [Solicola gregarius]